MTRQNNLYDQPNSPINIREICAVVFKHKYKILVTFLCIFAAAIAFATQIHRLYEARSLVLVKFGREFNQRPEEPNSGGGPAVPPQSIITGEMSILTSHDVLAKAVDAVGAVSLYPELALAEAQGNTHLTEAAVRGVERSLNVQNVPGSSLIAVSYAHPDPAMAAKLVNLLIEFFKEKHLEVFAASGTQFLENQLRTFQEKLKESGDSLADFRRKNKVISFDEQRTALMQQQNGLDAGIKTLQNQISELEQKIALIRSPKWVVETPQEMRTQLTTLERQERELLSRYTESSMAIQNIRREIRIAKDAIQQHSDEMRQTELKKADLEMSILKGRMDRMRRQFIQAEAEIRAFDAGGRQLQDLKRDVGEQEQNYQTYSRKLEESLIMDDMDRRKMVAISVVEQARVPIVPMQQKFSRKKVVAGGFFGGLAAGIALAFLLEFMSDCMTTPLSAEKRLGLPVMVAIAKKG